MSKKADSYIIWGKGFTNEHEAFDMSHHFEKRERAITEFLNDTLTIYSSRSKTKSIFQIIITSILLLLIFGFGFSIVYVIFYSLYNHVETTPLITSLVTSCVSFAGSVVSLFIVIVKYIFPSTEDENNMNILNSTMEVDMEYAKMNKNNK